MEQKKKKSKYTLFMCNPPTKRRRETITRFRWQSESNSIWTTTTKNRFIDSTFACPQWPGPASSGQGGREDAWTLVQTCFQKGQQQKRRESGACSIEQTNKHKLYSPCSWSWRPLNGLDKGWGKQKWKCPALDHMVWSEWDDTLPSPPPPQQSFPVVVLVRSVCHQCRGPAAAVPGPSCAPGKWTTIVPS